MAANDNESNNYHSNELNQITENNDHPITADNIPILAVDIKLISGCKCREFCASFVISANSFIRTVYQWLPMETLDMVVLGQTATIITSKPLQCATINICSVLCVTLCEC